VPLGNYGTDMDLEIELGFDIQELLRPKATALRGLALAKYTEIHCPRNLLRKSQKLLSNG